eukprot:TRINITY_DN16497_c0_g1_i1.p1 TRINITY_DN16497_c0_g1~~TRINITY_DN16497_c0_g1_i1.p1  ORF type:complete len:206 (+),score=21.88 TRINITY_DN16497_c0_g1_i1:90-707(+)
MGPVVRLALCLCRKGSAGEGGTNTRGLPYVPSEVLRCVAAYVPNVRSSWRLEFAEKATEQVLLFTSAGDPSQHEEEGGGSEGRRRPVRVWIVSGSDGWFHCEVPGLVPPTVVYAKGGTVAQDWRIPQVVRCAWPRGDEVLQLGSDWTVTVSPDSGEVHISNVWAPRQALVLQADGCVTFVPACPRLVLRIHPSTGMTSHALGPQW